MFETGLIPPTANLTTPNPAIKWEEYRLHAPTTVTSLSTRGSRALVAMTSSGIGGANGSCIVEGPPAPTASRGLDVEFWSSDADYPRLFVCGGLSPRTVSTVTETLLQQRQDGVDEAALSLTYGRRARSMPWLNYAIALPGESMRFTEPILSPKARGALVFVFSGQGPQHLASKFLGSRFVIKILIEAVGRELFRASNVFRESVLKLDNIYERTTGHSLILKYGLFDGLVEPESLLNDIWPIAVTLPALTIVQVALFDTLRFLGLKPDFVVGHSAGETATLYASGAASKEMTIQLSIARGRGLTPLEHLDCSMAAVNCSPVEAEGILTRVANELGPGSLEIGCYNSAEALTLSGANPNLARAVEVATELGFFARKLKTRVAVHSSMMEHCRETYCNAVNEVFAHHTLSKPTVAICSAATGEIMEAAGDADYFWSNSRGPVRFSQAIQTLVKAHPNASFVEVGPHPVLASYISSLVGSHATVTCPLQRPNPKKPTNGVELRSFLITLARLAVAGVHANYAFLSGSKAPLLRDLPAYPFQSKSVPVCLPSQQVKRFTRQRNGPLNFRGLCVNSQTHPSLADHLIKATPIMPAAGYIEMVGSLRATSCA
jgi:acyl transferase domain-containing protein